MADINKDNENALTHEILLDTLHYCPDTGIFTNIAKRPGVAVGKIMGTKLANGYIAIAVRGPKFLAHRLAWFYVYRKWPVHFIDHIDRIRDNNRITNLREASSYENSHNIKMLSTNTSGYTGVCKNGKRWRATVYHNNKYHYVGTYDTAEEANIGRILYKQKNNLL